MHSVTLLSGEKLCPIQACEQQSPSAVFYSATVLGEEVIGEDIQQLLQPIVSYSVQYNQQYDRTFYIPTHFHCLRGGGGDDGRDASDILCRVNAYFHTHFIYTLRDSTAVAYIALE